MRKTFRRVLVSLICVLMLAASILSASAAPTYTDVVEGNWYYEFVTYMSGKGIINGYTDSTFRPNNYVKRAEFIKMMVETFGLEDETSISYTDVESGDWYYSYYRKAAAQGFLTEVFTSKTTMDPEKYLTREEAAALLMAYMDYPDEDKAAVSYFADYNSISTAYKDYVLQAVDAKIIDGFDDGGVRNFRPKESLRRAQAAKILSTASGTIADKDVNGALDFADSDNLIVTENVSVKNLTIPGNVIISEGVSSGTVTFMNCEIEGFVSNRSSATVVFSGCTVEEINNWASGSEVELKQATEVAAVNVYAPYATVEFFTNSSVDDFVVEMGSSGVNVTGTGSIDKLEIKATNFKSTITPKDCEIASNISSANIGGVSYKEGVKGTPSTEWTSGNEYLDIETYMNGTVRYYYTTSASVPAKTAFNTNYNNADIKGSFDVLADRSYSERIDGPEIEDAAYVAVALLNGTTVVSTPVVINREAAKYGFEVSPTLTVSSGKDYVKLSPKTPGTLYYYYTSDSDIPSSYSSAMSIYNQTDTDVKDSISYSSTGSSSKPTKSVDVVSSYTYCVFFFLGNDDTRYVPVMVERPYMTNGLNAEPYVIIAEKDDGKDILTINAGSSGSVKWFYTNSTANFTTSNFDAEYNATPSTLRGSKSLSANKSTDVELAKKSDAVGYDYVIIEFGNNLPTRIQRRTSVTGFSIAPTAMKTTKTDLISFTTISAGKIWYMYIDSARNFSTESFMSTYNTVNEKYKGNESTTGYEQELTSVEKSADISYGYIAFMFKDSYGEHKPVVVERKAIGHGFNGTPTVEFDTDNKITTLNLTATAMYDIQYFATDTYFSESALVSEFTHLVNDPNLKVISKTDVVVKNNDYDLKISTEHKYIAVRARYNNDVMFSPVLITVDTVDDGLKPRTDGLGSDAWIDFSYSGVYDEITIKANPNTYGGTFQYCYSKTEPKTANDYKNLFGNASLPSGSKELDQASTGAEKTYIFSTVRSASVVDYVYLVYRVIDANGVSMDPGYVEIPIAHRRRAVITASSDSEIVVQPSDKQVYTVKWVYTTTQITNLTPATLNSKYNSTSSKYKGNESIQAKNDGEQIRVATSFAQPNDGKTVYKYVYIMLVDASGNNYIPIELKVPGTYTEIIPTT